MTSLNLGFPFNNRLVEEDLQAHQIVVSNLQNDYLEQAVDLGPNLGFVAVSTKEKGLVALTLYSSNSEPRYFVSPTA